MDRASRGGGAPSGRASGGGAARCAVRRTGPAELRIRLHRARERAPIESRGRRCRRTDQSVPEEEVMQFNDILAALDIDLAQWKGNALTARSPLDGATLATLAVDTPADAERKIDAAHNAFLKWRTVPAPRRGELVRLFGEELRAAQGRARPAGDARDRQDPREGARRSAGNDRHLRLRGRPVAPALRPDDRLRAPGPPDDAKRGIRWAWSA